jgi:4-hydroxysphinganine ceramide fatty acyl 2-hydroxylase
MGDELSHGHSEAAYEILDEHIIGFIANKGTVNAVAKSSHADEMLLRSKDSAAEPLANGDANGNTKAVYAATGMSSEADLSIETDVLADYKTHKFLDLNKPLMMQVWNGGFSKDFYLEQVHRPRHYKGGRSAPLFGNFLEPLTKTPWWVVPMVWLPPVAYGSFLAYQGLGSFPLFVALWMSGVGLWTFVEYCLHRFLFHIDK